MSDHSVPAFPQTPHDFRKDLAAWLSRRASAYAWCVGTTVGVAGLLEDGYIDGRRAAEMLRAAHAKLEAEIHAIDEPDRVVVTVDTSLRLTPPPIDPVTGLTIYNPEGRQELEP